MQEALEKLLQERCYRECRNLAEETLGSGVQTMTGAAVCHHAIARACLGLNDAVGAVKAGEHAQILAEMTGDRDLEGRVLIDLATGYSRLRRYADESRALERYLERVDSPDKTGGQGPEALQGLGRNRLRRGEYGEAVRCLTQAMCRAAAAGDEQVAETSRRLLRKASIGAGLLDEVKLLLKGSRTFIKHHPQDREALFWYWHDRSDFAMASCKTGQAEKTAWLAVNAALGEVPLEFAGYMLHYRHQLAGGCGEQAMRFACEARVCALQGGRFDLAYEAFEAMLGLIEAHGPSVMKGLAGYYARRGVNLYRYVPEQLFRPL